MARLAIDTSSTLTSVAIENNSGKIVSCEVNTRDSHSQNLAQLVERACQEAALPALNEISEIVVGIGPGSFTGLRMGLSFAKGFSWLRKVPVYGLESFRAIALSEQSASQEIAVISDARRGEFFFSAYSRLEGKLEEKFPLGIYGSDMLAHFFKRDDQEDTLVLINAGCEKLPKLTALESEAKEIAAGLLVLPRHECAWSLPEMAELEPLYIRALSALTIADRRERGML